MLYWNISNKARRSPRRRQIGFTIRQTMGMKKP
jgi:hypothetical protein